MAGNVIFDDSFLNMPHYSSHQPPVFLRVVAEGKRVRLSAESNGFCARIHRFFNPSQYDISKISDLCD